MRTLKSRNSTSFETVPSRSRIRTVSVISRIRRSGASPVSSSALATCSTSAGSSSCRRAVFEIRFAHEPDLLLLAAPAQAERMGEGEAGELGRVAASGRWCVEPVEVDVECGLVVQRVDAVVRAVRYDH